MIILISYIFSQQLRFWWETFYENFNFLWNDIVFFPFLFSVKFDFVLFWVLCTQLEMWNAGILFSLLMNMCMILYYLLDLAIFCCSSMCSVLITQFWFYWYLLVHVLFKHLGFQNFKVCRICAYYLMRLWMVNSFGMSTLLFI